MQTNTWNIIYKQIHKTSYTNKYIKHHIQTNTMYLFVYHVPCIYLYKMFHVFVCIKCSMYLFVYDVPCISLCMVFYTFLCIWCSMYLFVEDVPYICLLKMFHACVFIWCTMHLLTSYTNKCMEHLMQTNTWNIIYKQIHKTSYTNKYIKHHIQTNTWNII
jgi:hypothetical protein